MRGERIGFCVLLGMSMLMAGWFVFLLHGWRVRDEPNGLLVIGAALNVMPCACWWWMFVSARRRRRAERAAEATVIHPASR